jgi:hypothetical protein
MFPVLEALTEPVATPVASVVADGWVNVTPVPVALSVTLAPLTGFPSWSLAVTWIEAVPVDTTMDEGIAAIVDCVAETAPAVTVTVGFWVIVMLLAVAVTTFAPDTVELRVPVV